MSEENVEIAKLAHDKFAAGGIAAALSSFADDVVAHPFPQWIEQSAYRGHDGLRALIAIWTDNFDEFELHTHEVHEVGDSVLILGEIAGRARCVIAITRCSLRSSRQMPLRSKYGADRAILGLGDDRREEEDDPRDRQGSGIPRKCLGNPQKKGGHRA